MKGGAVDSYIGITGVIRAVLGYTGYMLTLLSYQYISSYGNLFIYQFVEHFLLFTKVLHLFSLFCSLINHVYF